jgi:Holliday junction resolvase
MTDRPKINSRLKGSSGERELARVLFEELGVRLVRRLVQSRAGGHDLEPEPGADGLCAVVLAGLAIEVKRAAGVTPRVCEAWWQQTERQATAAGLIPCLAYRVDRAGWQFRLPLYAIVWTLPHWSGPKWTVDVGLHAFCVLVREGLIRPPLPTPAPAPAGPVALMRGQYGQAR